MIIGSVFLFFSSENLVKKKTMQRIFCESLMEEDKRLIKEWKLEYGIFKNMGNTFGLIL